MKNFISKGLLILSVVIFTLTSCEKKEGPQGPAGNDGNANVKTEIITVLDSEWEINGALFVVDKTSDLLTQDIIKNGLGLLYYEIVDDMWVALPYATIGFGIAENDLGIWTEESTGLTSETSTFKLVVIEGNMQSVSKNVDLSDYNSVKEYFNLTD
jgi:hypothetical protein